MSDINEFVLNRLDKIEDKIDDANDRVFSQLTEHNRLLSDYNESLREHMRRTKLLEDKVDPMHQSYQEKIIADKLHSNRWKRWLMILGAVSTLVGLLTGLASLLGML
jgi:Mg2+ and Co2+ transporter CorA